MSPRAVLAAALFVACLGISAAVSAGAAAAAADGSTVTMDRTIEDPRVAESSGLLTARRSRGVLWTINDSGNAPVVYAIGPTGTVVGGLRVSGVPNIDWEALAPTTAADGTPLIAIGDIGDNQRERSGIEIDLVVEPAFRAGTGGKAATTTRSPVRRLRLRYPDGPADAEALLADPRNRRLYVVTKGMLSTMVYAVPSSAWPGTPGAHGPADAMLQPVGRLGISLVTDGSVLPDGRVLLRTYGSMAVLPPLTPPPAWQSASADVPRLHSVATLTLPDQRQGEGLAIADAATSTVLLSSEGVGEAVLRLVPPSSFARAEPQAVADEGALQAASAAPVADARPEAFPLPTALAAGGAVIGVLLFAGWSAARHR